MTKHPVIVSAAMKHPDRDIIVCSPRHWDPTCRAVVAALNFDIKPDAASQWVQGFVDQFGVFYNRKEAYVVAYAQGQVKRAVGGQPPLGTEGVEIELYSENLY